jgi:hypothetical protein
MSRNSANSSACSLTNISPESKIKDNKKGLKSPFLF